MKKFFVALLSLLLTFALAVCGGETASNTTDKSDGEAQAIASQETSPIRPASYTLSDEERAIAEQAFGDYDCEKAVASAMIRMSIQKVNIGGPGQEFQDTPPGTYIADDSRLEMTKGNITYIWEQVEITEISEKDKLMYQEVLSRWFEGDFESITREVQALVEFMNGTNETIIIPQLEYKSDFFVRKTAEEEEAYVQRHFRS